MKLVKKRGNDETEKQLEEAKDEAAKLTERLDEVKLESSEYQKTVKQRKFCFSNNEGYEEGVVLYGTTLCRGVLSVVRLCKPREKVV